MPEYKSSQLGRYRAQLMDTANELPATQRARLLAHADSYLVGALAASTDDEAWDRAVEIALETAVRVGKRFTS